MGHDFATQANGVGAADLDHVARVMEQREARGLDMSAVELLDGYGEARSARRDHDDIGRERGRAGA
jgi:hypothetical protein